MALDESVRCKVLQRVEEEREQIISFLTELVRVRSLSATAGEGAAQEVVARHLRLVDGLEVEMWEPSVEELHSYELHPVRLGPWDYRGRPNMVGILAGAGGGRSLILNGHVDVASPEPLEAWLHNPWGGEVEGGRLYGRGACDMKGGLASMVYAVKAVRDAGVGLRGRLVVESVVEEEYGGGGTLSTLLRGYSADAAVVPEPTGSRALCIGACGSRFFRVKILGRPVIATIAHLGVNAIPLAGRLYEALVQLNEARWERLAGRHPLFEAEEPGTLLGNRSTNLTIGILRAGDWPSTVAGWAEMEGRIGFPPSERGVGVCREVEEAVAKAAGEDEWMSAHPPRVEWWGARREGYELQPGVPLVQGLRRSIQSVTGGDCRIYATPAAADTNYFTARVGACGGIPSVMYGPGGGGAHSPDEHVDLEEVVTVAKVLALTILDWCGVAP